jgi:hypothetical protein
MMALILHSQTTCNICGMCGMGVNGMRQQGGGVKDFKMSLMAHRRCENASLGFPQHKAFDHLKSIFKLWLGTAYNMTAAKIKYMLEQRLNILYVTY